MVSNLSTFRQEKPCNCLNYFHASNFLRKIPVLHRSSPRRLNENCCGNRIVVDMISSGGRRQNWVRIYSVGVGSAFVDDRDIGGGRFYFGGEGDITGNYFGGTFGRNTVVRIRSRDRND